LATTCGPAPDVVTSIEAATPRWRFFLPVEHALASEHCTFTSKSRSPSRERFAEILGDVGTLKVRSEASA